MQQETQQVGAAFGEQAAFIEPEILKIDKATLDHWTGTEPRLGMYRHYIDDIQRRRPHMLSDAEERLLALSSVVDGIAEGLPAFHRYLQLRKKMMKLPAHRPHAEDD